MEYGNKGSMTSKFALADYSNIDFSQLKFTRNPVKNARAVKIAPTIFAQSKAFGLDPVLTMTQWAIESGWGARKSGKNNPFGFTAVGKPNAYWKGDYKLCRTWEEIRGKKVVMNRKFRSYDTVEDGICDYLRLIRNGKVYEKVRTDGIVGLQIYATASSYVDLVKKIYNSIGKILEKNK